MVKTWVNSRWKNPRLTGHFSAEINTLAAIASHLGRSEVRPDELRRNVVTRGINLLALKEKRFRLGAAVLETTGECHPCSRMEEILGVGGYNAARGLGGITARVAEGGFVGLSDQIVSLPPEA